MITYVFMGHSLFNIKHQTSNVKRQTSNVKHQTSNIKRQTSNIFYLSCGVNPYMPDIVLLSCVAYSLSGCLPGQQRCHREGR